MTTTSNISLLSGYQDQRNSFAKDTRTSALKNENPSQIQADEVILSRKAKELQQIYDKKTTVLQQTYVSESQRLEAEYTQEKNRLKNELSQKRQSLEIDLYV